MKTTRQLVDELYRSHFGKMVALLLAYSRKIDIVVAEDLVQESFASAVAEWERAGPPINPTGWIYQVCRNKALNWIRREKGKSGLRTEQLVSGEIPEYAESTLQDYQLRLLFACAHPSLAPKAQVVITLKYVVGFKVEALAIALAMTVDGVDKILVRSRQKITDEKILLEEPHDSVLMSRLPIVHKVLYLIFNEGYRTSSGPVLIRRELCEDALIMCRVLIHHTVANPDTKALYSLMLFNSARLDARFDDDENIIDLEHQNRNCWNKELVSLGLDYLDQSRQEPPGIYHLEASIAALHVTATSFPATNWPIIAQLYAKLMHLTHNPFVNVNRAIALYYSGGRDEAFAILEELHRHPFFNQYFPLTSALGKLHALAGRSQLASKFLNMALTQTKLAAEKRFILQIASRFQIELS